MARLRLHPSAAGVAALAAAAAGAAAAAVAAVGGGVGHGYGHHHHHHHHAVYDDPASVVEAMDAEADMADDEMDVAPEYEEEGGNDAGEEDEQVIVAAGAPIPLPLAAAPVLDASQLIEAASEGDLPQVMSLVNAEPNLVNECDGCGQSALMWASYKGQAEVVNFLLSRGAVANRIEHRRQRTALYLASEFGHDATVARLLEAGADPRAIAARSWTVLGRGVNGWTPLIIASYNNNLNVVRLLLNYAARTLGSVSSILDTTDEHGATALWWAAKRGRAECVRILLRAGADWTVQAVDGKSVLTVARERGHAETAELVERELKAYEICRARKIHQEERAHMAASDMREVPEYLRRRITEGYPLPTFVSTPKSPNVSGVDNSASKPISRWSGFFSGPYFAEEICERAESEVMDMPHSGNGSLGGSNGMHESLMAATDRDTVQTMVEDMQYDTFVLLKGYLGTSVCLITE